MLHKCHLFRRPRGTVQQPTLPPSADFAIVKFCRLRNKSALYDLGIGLTLYNLLKTTPADVDQKAATALLTLSRKRF